MRAVTRFTPLFILGLIAVAVPWLACVGDDPQIADDNAGREGAACLPNGGCDQGPACITTPCGRVAAGSGGGQDSSTGEDATSDAGFDAPSSGDGGCDATITPAPIPSNVRCGDGGSSGCPLAPNAQVCCANGTCNANGANCPNQAYWQCD